MARQLTTAQPATLTRVLSATKILRIMLLIVVALITFMTVSGAIRFIAAHLPGADIPPVDIASPLPLSGIFTPEVRHWSPLIQAWAKVYKVDPNLIATVIQIESCGDPTAVSSAGAQGLFQVMPSHFADGENAQEILTNGKRGMEYLAATLQKAAGDAGLALAGYNGGQGVITVGWARWSAETRRYYKWGTGIYADASKGLGTSPAVQSWLNAGGQALCQRAAVHQVDLSK